MAVIPERMDHCWPREYIMIITGRREGGKGRNGWLVYAKQLLDPINVPSRHPPIDTSGLFGSSIIVIKISKADEQRRDSRKLRVRD